MRRVGLVLGVLASLIALVSVSSIAGASAPAPLAGVPVAPSASSSLAPVVIHFTPKSISGAPGTTIRIAAFVKDKGAYNFVATSCILWIRLGTSGAWTKSGTCLKSSDFPHTFSAHSKTKFSASAKIGKTAPAGTYEWKIELVGTYNGVTEDSHSGTFTLTIT